MHKFIQQSWAQNTVQVTIRAEREEKREIGMWVSGTPLPTDDKSGGDGKWWISNSTGKWYNPSRKWPRESQATNSRDLTRDNMWLVTA